MCVEVKPLKHQLFTSKGEIQGQCVLEVALAANANVTSLRLTASAANITAIMPKLASF